MKLNYTTFNGRLSVELEADSQVELWEKLAQFQEVFDNTTCVDSKGNKSEKVYFQVRENDGNKFYELVCLDEDNPNLRFARRSFGVHRTGKTLFPKDKKWVKWDKESKEEKEL